MIKMIGLEKGDDFIMRKAGSQVKVFNQYIRIAFFTM